MNAAAADTVFVVFVDIIIYNILLVPGTDVHGARFERGGKCVNQYWDLDSISSQGGGQGSSRLLAPGCFEFDTCCGGEGGRGRAEDAKVAAGTSSVCRREGCWWWHRVQIKPASLRVVVLITCVVTAIDSQTGVFLQVGSMSRSWNFVATLSSRLV